MSKIYKLYGPDQRKIDNLKRKIRGYEKMKMDLTNTNKRVNNTNKQLNEEIKKLKQQQKEFIGYLEKEIVDCRAGSSQYYSAIEHLKLYNKVIGGDK